MAKVFPSFIPVSDYPLTIPGVSFPSEFESFERIRDQVKSLITLSIRYPEGDKRRFLVTVQGSLLSAAGLFLRDKEADPNARVCIDNIIASFTEHISKIDILLDDIMINHLSFELAKMVWWIESLPDQEAIAA